MCALSGGGSGSLSQKPEPAARSAIIITSAAHVAEADKGPGGPSIKAMRSMLGLVGTLFVIAAQWPSIEPLIEPLMSDTIIKFSRLRENSLRLMFELSPTER